MVTMNCAVRTATVLYTHYELMRRRTQMKVGTETGSELCECQPHMTNSEIGDVLKRRIVADLHLGRLKPGGRLPSLRTIARELNVSIRSAARAYANLEREGLVTVRGRSGIYLVAPFAVEIPLEEPLNWYADMLS